MKLKLDENVDLRVVTFLRLAGHDVETVPNQGLTSAPDVELINVCRQEERCLVDLLQKSKTHPPQSPLTKGGSKKN